MNRLLAILLALAPATLVGQSLEGWETTRWGMTDAEVRDVLGARLRAPAFEGAPLEVDSVTIGDIKFRAQLFFSESNPTLHHVALSPSGVVGDPRRFYDAVFDRIAARHGRPIIDRRAAWGTTESRQSSWRVGPTTIDLEQLVGPKQGALRLSYRPSTATVFVFAPIPYLEPSAFRNLPAGLKEKLGHLGCQVPQPWSDSGPQNVLSGRFMSPGEKSWAVLCSRAGTSAILVFSEPRFELLATLEPSQDSNFFGDSQYLRMISVADREFIQRHDEMYGNVRPLPKLDHDGINDAYVGKGSSILFFDGKTWRHLAGAD